jgi:hypothetical protein
MLYQNEIFISYAHLDNETAIQGQNGWISDFHRALEVRVAQLLGRKPTVWRDPKLTGNDLFPETIVDRLGQTAVLVTILSPRYIKSEWCRREFHSFCDTFSETPSSSPGTKSRIFKVVKTPLPSSLDFDLQPLLQPLLGYEFFKVDSQSGHFHELDLAFGPAAMADYWLRLDDLAQDVAKLLDSIVGAVKEPNAPDRPLVYLAETSVDVKEQYSSIRRDLERKGYLVLPRQSLPLEADKARSFVCEQLSQCAISVHLFGSHYGVVPDGSSLSLAEMQHETAIQCSQQKGLIRLVWLRPGVRPEDARQQGLIDRLRSDPRWDQNADLLETSIESVKTLIEQRLSDLETQTKIKVATPVSVSAADQLRRIYLICDEQDRQSIASLRDFLFDQRFEVILPMFEGDETEVRLDHEDNLRTCDSAIIYHGESPDLFLRRKLREVRKILGGPGSSRLRLIIVCLAQPVTAEKQSFRTLEATLINQTDGFNPEAWQPVLNQIRAKGASG